MSHLKIVLAQLNLTVGDIDGNLAKHIQAAKKARDDMAADVIVFPELSLTGYPAEDLLLRPEFIAAADVALQQFVREVKGIYCLVSHPVFQHGFLHNTCSLVYDGQILARYAKQCLPNYGVFDELRYFAAGNEAFVIDIKGVPTSLLICEDLWVINPVQQAAAKGARLILSPNASPFEVDKHEDRVDVLSKCAQENNVAIVYVNTVGGQDELVFDGGSMVIDSNGNVCQCAGFFEENLLPVSVTITEKESQIEAIRFSAPSKKERIYSALMLGLRDYVEKNHLPGVLIGVSGGIDSALTLTLAVDALGKDRVMGIIMPSRYTANISIEDAKQLIHQLGVRSETISIEPSYSSFLESLAPVFADKKPDVTEENIQARCRAVILMALSNKSGYLVLTTGNRSELATGYCTLYGDMAGGFAPLKDVPKTLVYALADYRNQIGNIIPERTLYRAPTAELAPNQKDEDSLPPYHVLDELLEGYLNHAVSIDEMIAVGFDEQMVRRIVQLIYRNEYKRRQGALGPHINHKSFGKDWRYPLTNRFGG